MYDSKNKTALLGHIDDFTEIESLEKLFTILSKENTVAHLLGGNVSSQEMCLDVIELLEKNQIKIVNSDIVRTSLDSASMAIDARTGNVYTNVCSGQLHQTTDVKKRLQLACLQVGSSPLTYYASSKSFTSTLEESAVISEKTSSSLLSDASQSNNFLLNFLMSEKSKETNQPNNNCGFKTQL